MTGIIGASQSDAMAGSRRSRPNGVPIRDGLLGRSIVMLVVAPAPADRSSAVLAESVRSPSECGSKVAAIGTATPAGGQG